MQIVELKEEHYIDFIDGVISSFTKDYIPLGITRDSAKSNGSFFCRNHLFNDINKGVNFYAILENDKVIAGLGILIDKEFCKVKKLFVIPSHQKKGIGKNLLEFAKDYALSNSIKKIKLGMILENKSLHQFYINCGFTDKKITYNKKMNLNIAFMEKKF